MRALSLLLLSLYLFAALIVVGCSSSDDEEDKYDSRRNHRNGHFSSDDEDSVDGGSTGLEEALASIEIEEKFIQSSSSTTTSASSSTIDQHRPVMCLDGQGREVDWWFVYKEPGGLRYLSFSSLDVKNDRDNFHPLKHYRLINDPISSPVLRTIYQGNGGDASKVWFGWNDQPDTEIEKEANRDAYGNTVNGSKHAHSKGFYAINAPNNDTTIGAYAIMTSLPRFPKLVSTSPTSFGEANRNRLPPNPQNIFDSNLRDKAQHFMCTSFPRRNIPRDENNAFPLNDPNAFVLNQTPAHLQFLTKYLKTIHPAIVGTNFSDRNRAHQIWRNYFSMLRVPYEKALHYYNDYWDINIQLQAYNQDEIPSYMTRRGEAFPLSTSPFYVHKNGYIYHEPNNMKSRWSADFAAQNGCLDGSQKSCLASFSFKTTNTQSEMNVNMFAKHGSMVLDIFDDWAALQVVEAQKGVYTSYDGQVITRYGLLVQSWIDGKSALPRKPDKKIFDTNGDLMASVHIDNRSSLTMPVKNQAPLKITSIAHDHSKWALGFALDTFNHNTDDFESIRLEKEDYSFIPVFFLSDLNRATTQACLKDKTFGRGGGILSTDNVSLWRAMMLLQPQAQKQKFANSGKTKQKDLQNRLRIHTRTMRMFDSNSLSLKGFRQGFFQALRLSKNEGKKMIHAIPFIPMLRELDNFIRKALFRPEHTAIAAFHRLWSLISQGKIDYSAQLAWDQTREQKAFHDDSYPFIKSSVFYKLPQLQLFRTLPPTPDFSDDEYELYRKSEAAPYIVQDKITSEIKSGDMIDSFSQMISKNRPKISIATQCELEEEKDVVTEEEEEEEEEEDEDSSASQEDSENSHSNEESDDNTDYSYVRSDDDERSSGYESEDPRDTEYYDIMERQWAENDGEDYESGSDYSR